MIENRVREVIHLLLDEGGAGRPSVVRGKFFDPRGNSPQLVAAAPTWRLTTAIEGIGRISGCRSAPALLQSAVPDNQNEDVVALIAFVEAAEEAGSACENDGLGSSPDRSSGRR